jgi:acyl-CoA synthetase (AMP-forming)/AMP-acid ligase II
MRRVQVSPTLEIVDTLVYRLHRRALEQPEQVAYTFLTYNSTDVEKQNLTYKELDERAQAISADLHRRGAAGKPVLLFFPSGLDYIAAYFGCLYAGAIAIPAYIPQSARALPRIQAILDDSQAEFVLTTTSVLTKLMRWVNNVPDLIRLTWIATDALDIAPGDYWRDQAVDLETLAFLQYTSGSTATPKGVMVSHGNLMHNLALVQYCFRADEIEKPVGVYWLPMFHDMGLILGILSGVYSGYPIYLMTPADFLQRPLRWLQAISEYRGTMSSAPNFAYELCVRRIQEKDLLDLDLSSWVCAGNAAEPVRASTIERFAHFFARCGFSRDVLRPGYGLAEATLLVSSARAGDPICIQYVDKARLDQKEFVESEAQQGQPMVSCGQPVLSQHVVIVDPETALPCKPQQIGEIWVSSQSVTGGYWRREEENEHTFHAYLATGDGPFLRTGDLGALYQNNLFITGRLKDLVILDGRNLYPQDIEYTVEKAHPAIRPECCVAFSVDDGDKESLVVLAEIDHRYRPSTGEEDYQLDFQEIIKKVREAIATHHEILVQKVLLLKIGGILKTSSGKPQRRACRQAFLQGELKAWNE